MTTLREAAQMALDALEDACGNRCNREHNPCLQREAAEAIRAALVAEQEPVAWMHTTATGYVYFRKKPHDKVFNPQPVYIAPPQREWQGLTDEEIGDTLLFSMPINDYKDFVRAIEAKLKEKNT